MKTLEELYSEIKNLNNDEKEKLFEKKANDVLPFLEEISDKNFDGHTILYSFILGAVLADGKLSFEEANMFTPFFKNVFHEKVDLNEINDIFASVHSDAKDTNDYLHTMLSILGSINYVAKEDILSMCLIVLSFDTLQDSEIEWLKKLY